MSNISNIVKCDRLMCNFNSNNACRCLHTQDNTANCAFYITQDDLYKRQMKCLERISKLPVYQKSHIVRKYSIIGE